MQTLATTKIFNNGNFPIYSMPTYVSMHLMESCWRTNNNRFIFKIKCDIKVLRMQIFERLHLFQHVCFFFHLPRCEESKYIWHHCNYCVCWICPSWASQSAYHCVGMLWPQKEDKSVRTPCSLFFHVLPTQTVHLSL